MQNRRILGIALFVIGVIAFLVWWLFLGQLQVGALLGLLFAIVGFILYRRGG